MAVCASFYRSEQWFQLLCHNQKSGLFRTLKQQKIMTYTICKLRPIVDHVHNFNRKTWYMKCYLKIYDSDFLYIYH